MNNYELQAYAKYKFMYELGVWLTAYCRLS